jgi:hypothetical protein
MLAYLHAYKMKTEGRGVQKVNDHPTPIASIKGTIAAELPAPKRYWTMYLVQMTSAFLAGSTSSQISITIKKTHR